MNIDKILSRLPIKALRDRVPLVPVVRLDGVIAAQGSPLRAALNISSLAEPLERAFSMKGAKAVALVINSPGGSPVQSALVHDRIRLLADENELPVYIFCEDVAASGGYWIACAGDEIYAAETSIIGSIGVIAATFGFEGAMEKLGVERRLFTAGDKKSLLDPFLPVAEDDLKRLTALQKEIHDAFKKHVRTRREGRLKAGEKKLFSGEFWTGAKAEGLGLIDGLGDLKSVMRQKFGKKVRLPVIGAEKSWLQRRLGFASQITAMDLPGDLLAAAEVRAYWARYGL
ncbi:MAG: S49 family peptidase [Rhodospirillaceae bacterium]|jgi:signal peptide peptidase SppA|nr:S49 family peptidase [Rhodospirillaceae bacterium]MBT4045812.1 S49 family peptidase [Rhodospirillaceae bacterium]MBT4690109.1 S49 family peptidase [Rhodospirillaceae bacterium]MBT5080674.1 S49 family peptidase [Rhodospirillaceae bacterium]MBT5524202.1 S49 family peptidase [Rhodospirillaceae bacterium]